MSAYYGPVYLQGSGPFRAIGNIIADVTVKESGTDEIEITQHPVEYGASITDHAFVKPAVLTLEVGFSDCSNYDGYVSDAYAALLALQATRQPITVYTGKRVYTNILIPSIAQVTDQESECSLHITAQLKEILLVSLSTSNMPPTQNQANPQSTAPPTNTGQATLQTPPQQDSSWLNNTFGTG